MGAPATRPHMWHMAWMGGGFCDHLEAMPCMRACVACAASMHQAAKCQEAGFRPHVILSGTCVMGLCPSTPIYSHLLLSCACGALLR